MPWRLVSTRRARLPGGREGPARVRRRSLQNLGPPRASRYVSGVSLIESCSDVKAFFRESLLRAVHRRAVEVPELTEFYLVELLARSAHAGPDAAFGATLVQRLADAAEAPDSAERFRRFRSMGDAALYTSGFFADHLHRRGISASYVAAMGTQAYRTASSLSSWGGEAAFSPALDELAARFGLYAAVLDEVRESTALRTPQDVVRLYDRWRRTRSPLLAERLREEGVYPVPPSGETIH